MSHRRESIIIFNADTILGEAIVRELLDPQHRHRLSGEYSHVFATVRSIGHSGDLCAIGACLVEMGENPDENKLAECLKECNVTTLVLVPDCGSRNMVQQAKKIIQASKRANIQKAILMSTLGADETTVELGKWLHEIEQHFKEASHSTAAIVRHAPFQQCLFAFRKMLCQQKLKLPLKEDSRFTLISLRDVANFVAHELLEGERRRPTRGGEPHIYKLTGPSVHTTKEVCQLLERVVGQKIQYQQIDRQEFEHYLREEVGLPEIIAKLETDGMEIINKGKMNFVSDDLKKTIGKDPMKLEEWLNKHKDLFHEGRQ